MTILEDLKLQYRTGGIANKFIYLNVGCFVVSLVFYNFKQGFFDFPSWIALSSDLRHDIIFPWTYVSYAFLHNGFGHIFFNMLVLNFYSRLFLTFFTERQYIGLYFLSAIFSGLCFTLIYFFLGISSLIVGASGVIMAILIATTTYQPLMDIRLMFIGNIKLWHLTGVILLLDLMQILIDNTGGHIAHLGGALFGFVFIKLLENGTDLSKGFYKVITIFEKKQKTPFKKVHVNPKKKEILQESKIVIKNKSQQQIDEILDKIGKSGYDSLTDDEKEFLFKAGN